MRDFLLHRGQKFILYLTFHSYGQYILYPWGYDKVRTNTVAVYWNVFGDKRWWPGFYFHFTTEQNRNSIHRLSLSRPTLIVIIINYVHNKVIQWKMTIKSLEALKKKPRKNWSWKIFKSFISSLLVAFICILLVETDSISLTRWIHRTGLTYRE